MAVHSHDRFFKSLLRNSEQARAFLAGVLPDAVTQHLELDRIEPVPGSFVDPQLQEHISDLLFRVPRQDARDANAWVYALLEHKSQPDPILPLQLLRYMVRIWQQEAEQKRAPPLSPIIPLVFYHGAQRWSVPHTFAGLVDRPADLACFVPDFAYEIYEPPPTAEVAFHTDEVLQAGMLALHHALRGTLADHLPEILRGLRTERGLSFLEVFVRYLLDAGESIDAEDLRAAAETTFPERGEELMATIGERLRSEGREQGRQEGRQEERAQLLVELVEAGRLDAAEGRRTLEHMLREGKITEAQAEAARKRIREAEAE